VTPLTPVAPSATSIPGAILAPDIGWAGQIAAARVVLHRSIHDRETSDVKLSYVWLVLFVLAPSVRNTLGYFALAVFFATGNLVLLLIFGGITLLASSLMHGIANRKMLRRMTRHFDREARLRGALIDYLYAKAAADRKLAEATGSLLAMAKIHGEAGARDRGRSGLWAFLVALPLVRYYFYYFISRFPAEHEQRWVRFLHHTEVVSRTLGVAYLTPEIKPVKRHNFWLFLLLSIITSELFLVYWYFLLIREPHLHFKSHEHVDDALLLAFH